MVGVASQNAGNGRILSSRWEGLNPLLIAKFYEVEKNPADGTCSPVKDGVEVHAPIIGDTVWEYQLNWQSPFENTGPENKAPALAAMLQSGALQPFINQFLGLGRTADQAARDQSAINQFLGLGRTADQAARDQSAINRQLREFEGRTGITRLNSTQTFTGMPPDGAQITLLFRAFSNAYAEVEAPFAQLMDWGLPQQLSADGTLVSALKKAAGQGNSVVDVLMPSKAPKLIAMEYKRRTYAPLVIESIGEPITAPTASDGYYASLQVPIKLNSLTAKDAPEMRGIRAFANPYLKRQQ